MTIASEFTYGLSPEEDDINNSLFDEGDDDLVGNVTAPPKRKSSSAASRKGPQGADKRATHNAIERARRESLNGRFMTLAEALPSMSKVKRPSKSVIVNKALDFVFEAQVKEHALIRENNELRREVDNLRQQLGLPPLPPPADLNKTTAQQLEEKKTKASSSGTNASRASVKAMLVRQDSIATNASIDSTLSAADLTQSIAQLDTGAGHLHSPSHSSMSGGDKLSPASSFPSPPSMSDGSDSFSPTAQFSTSAPAAQAAYLQASPFAFAAANQHAAAAAAAQMAGPALNMFPFVTPQMMPPQNQQQLLYMQQQYQQSTQPSFEQLYGALPPALMNGAWAASFPGH